MKVRPLFRILLMVMMWVSSAPAATLVMQFDPQSGTAPDLEYPGISTVSTGTTNIPGVVATLAGRGYGVEQVGGDRWGISAGALAWDASTSGWTIRNGFAPDKVGETISTDKKVEVPASFLTVKLSGLVSGTLFQNVALTFSGATSLRPSKAWAGTSADAFASATSIRSTVAGGSQQLSVTLPDFTYFGGDPLEIRLYGIIGNDEGAFTVATVAGDYTTPIAIPEPDVEMLLATILVGAVVSFRRRSRGVPR